MPVAIRITTERSEARGEPDLEAPDSKAEIPFARFGFLPVGGRSTAVKLSSGDVWVLASTPLDDATKNKLEEIGPVKCIHDSALCDYSFFKADEDYAQHRYIIGADLKHHLYLGDFKKQYPEAVVIAPETVVNKKSKQGLVFGGAWGTNPTNAKYGFEGDIQHWFASSLP
ncbi:hypothetical protein PHLCEN_2v5546 [Hermanssonia centrifuga]|uniref:Uncharacterized protein n=1 Tax=Hermanssonia centrifuga TaxID=98765 RepID=A0A2R6P233_9APHY|nr:hypothetical protein PHLCEN_2v5546 [Hermanssonia centrifuga]